MPLSRHGHADPVSAKRKRESSDMPPRVDLLKIVAAAFEFAAFVVIYF